MACPMVLQAVVGVWQLLLSLPLTPFTYHVVLANAAGKAANNVSATTHISLWDFIFSSRQVEEFRTGAMGLGTHILGGEE
jgi:hypothetical protein